MKCAALILLCSHSAFSAFLTCQDQTFCREIRDGSKKSTFSVNSTDFGVNEEDVVASIYDEVGRNFNLVASSLANGMFRIKIEEPGKTRYDLKDTLDGEPSKIKLDISITSSKFVITNGPNELMVYFEPLKIEVYENEELIIVVNEKGMLNYNTYDNDKSISVDFKFLGVEVAYGIPEHAERLSLQNTLANGSTEPYRMFNTDYCCYPIGTKEALYGSIPVLYAHGVKRTSGVFWLNSAQTFVDINPTEEGNVESLFISQTGTFDLFILTGPTLQETVAQYTSLTGRAALPPLFSLGHHQSRWSYMSQEDALTVVKEMDNHDFPFDVIWLDIDYTDNFKYFTWNLDTFPLPVEMQQYIASTKRNLVLIIDPHIKREEGYFVFDTATEKGYFVKANDGSDFKGLCWPGWSSWLDFLNPEAAEYYSGLFTTFANTTDIVHIWNDMNEPAIFDVSTNTMPDDNVHYGGVLHEEVHNIYGFSQTVNTHAGLLQRYKGEKRPFILTRSHYAGSQRHTAVWTGDNVASWEHLKISIPMCLTLSISGISNCGADVGGFVDEVTDELLQRWYQTGAWLPFFRAHSSSGVERREPYLFPEDVQTRLRNALRERYYHLPLWYTLFFEHERYGEPIIRPLSYHYSSDPNTLDMDDQFLVGKNVLVHPVTYEATIQIQVYLPGGTDEYWYDIVNNYLYFGTGFETLDVNMDSLPVFYKGGSITARFEQHRPSSQHMHDDPYTIYAFLDKNNYAESNIYFDDYETFDYRQNKYNYLQMIYDNIGGFLVNTLDVNAEFERDFKVDKLLVYHHPDSAVKHYSKAKVNGKTYNVRHVDDVHFVVENLNLTIKKNCEIKFA